MIPRLAMIVHEDGPGGGPVAIVNQIAWLKERYAISVLAGGRGSIAAYCDASGLPFVQISGTGKRAALRFWLRMKGAIRRSRPDLLVSFGQWGGALAGRIARRFGVRHVYIAEWPAFYTDWDLFRMARNRWCERSACRGADAVVALTPGNAYEFLYRRLVEEDQIHVIPNPVRIEPEDPEEAMGTFRTETGCDPERRHVVSVSRLASQKCLHWLLGAWPRVAASCPDALLWIVGDGELRNELADQAARLEIGGSVRFTGERSDARRFMQAADVAVATTMYEAFGIAVVEAMASGTPVVANRVAGVSDIVTDGEEGFLVAPGDVATLSERIIQLLQDPDLARRMGAKGRERAACFSVDAVMPRYAALYDRVLSPGQSSRRCPGTVKN